MHTTFGDSVDTDSEHRDWWSHAVAQHETERRSQ
jgi:hypothetical protein